jgi:hypothetical protein
VSWIAGSTALAIVQKSRRCSPHRLQSGSSRLGDRHTGDRPRRAWRARVARRDWTGRATAPVVASPAGRGHLRGLVDGPLLDTLSAKSSHEHSSGPPQLRGLTALSRTFEWAIGASIGWAATPTRKECSGLSWGREAVAA